MEQEQCRREKQTRGCAMRGRPSRIERHTLPARVRQKENIEVRDTNSAGIFQQEHRSKTEHDRGERPREDDLTRMLRADRSGDQSKSEA